jgi:iron complex transport system substrate-binding protein
VACPIGPAPSLTAHLSLPGMGGIIFRKTERAEKAERTERYCRPRARAAIPSPFSVLCVLSVFLTTCVRTPAQRGSIQLVDDAGDTLRLSAAARRVVSLIPAATELLFAIGADTSVVGRTSYCDYPAAAKAVPDLGDGIKPSIEAIVARRPDLVVLYNSGQNAAVAGRLRELGIPEVRLNTDALSDVGRVAELLGRLTGHQRAADSVVTVFDTALASATRAPTSSRPKVLLLVWEQPPMTIGRGSFLSELVERAGGENLFADVTASSGVVSIEAVAARKPDLIFTTTEGPSSFASRPEWQVVPAVREHRFLRVSGSEFNRPSPRAPAAIRALAARLAGAEQ